MRIQIDKYSIFASSDERETLMIISVDGHIIIQKTLFGKASREGIIKIAVDSISIYNSLHGCE